MLSARGIGGNGGRKWLEVGQVCWWWRSCGGRLGQPPPVDVGASATKREYGNFIRLTLQSQLGLVRLTCYTHFLVNEINCLGKLG